MIESVLFAIIVASYFALTQSLCYINTATAVDKHMLLSGTSYIVNNNVETMIKKQALRSGISPSLIKGCVEAKKNEIRQTTYVKQRQDYIHKINQQNSRLRKTNKG